MRFPFPERIPLKHAGLFAAALLCVQVGMGTGIYFSTCVFLFILLCTYGFNISGGLFRSSGAYIFFLAVLGIVLSQVMKIVLGEAADTNLHEPDRTITVYLVGAAGMTLAAVLNRRIRPSRSLIEQADELDKLPQMALGCFVMGAGFTWLSRLYGGNDPGTVWAALNQLGFFQPLAAILATYDAIRSSGGRRSVNALVLLAVTYPLLLGAFDASKEEAFASIAGYFLTCASLRYRFRWLQIALLAATLGAVVYVAVPLIQIMKGFADLSRGDRLSFELQLLSNPGTLVADYQASQADFVQTSPIHYYNVGTGLMDRFSLISISSYLVEFTDHGHIHGWHPMLLSVESIVPHFIWANKPQNYAGNGYARELGIVGEEDTTTGVSFPLFAEAYTMAGMVGVFVGSALCLTIFFLAYDCLLPDVRTSPWGLLALVAFTHQAPEGSLTTILPAAAVTTLKIWFVVMMVRHVLPSLANLLTGPNRKHLTRIPAARPILSKQADRMEDAGTMEYPSG